MNATIEPAVTPVPRSRGDRAARMLFMGTALLFVLTTLFDPADLLFGVKVPLYLLLWGAGALLCLSRPGTVRIPGTLVGYTMLMVTIPLVSIAVYYLTDGSAPFAGFQMFKAYLFISMAVLLYITGTNLVRQLSLALTVLAAAILVVAAVVLTWPQLLLPLYVFGNEYGMFTIDNRDYGSGLVLFQMYFATSPMLTISTAYFFHQAWTFPERRAFHWTLAAVNVAGLALAGSRNNLLAAVVLPLLLLLLHARRKAPVALLIGATALGGAFMLRDKLSVLLDPTEVSNRTKLGLLGDYSAQFESLQTLLLGRGLGAYEYWTGRPYYFVTELTYLEVIRNFGIVMGGIMILLLLYPLLYAFVLRRDFGDRSIATGYAMYLVMCISNPNLFSSMGMLILSVLLANIAFHARDVRAAGGRDDWRHATPSPAGSP